MSTHNIPIFHNKKENHSRLSQICSYGIFLGTQERFETAVVNEPPVFEPLQFYCITTVTGNVDLWLRFSILNASRIIFETSISKSD